MFIISCNQMEYTENCRYSLLLPELFYKFIFDIAMPPIPFYLCPTIFGTVYIHLCSYSQFYKDAVFDTNEKGRFRHTYLGNPLKSRALTVQPVIPAEQ